MSMAITVFPAADYTSYISHEAANDYLTTRRNDAWLNAASYEQESALIEATDYIDLVYQPRDKENHVDLLARATVLLAVSALKGGLVVEAEREAIETEDELSGVGKQKRKFSEKDFDRFPIVSNLLAPISSKPKAGGSYSVSIVR